MIDAVANYFAGPLGRLELIATVLLIANVYLLAKQRLSNFAFGFAGVVLFGFLLKANELYSDMLLQWLFFAPVQIVGFVSWRRGKPRDHDTLPLTVSWLRPNHWLAIAALIGAATAALGTAMAQTDASFPYADALTTVLSIMASVLMLRKFIENWVLWITMDLIAIPIYYAKALYVVSGLYVVFLGLSVFGLIAWVHDRRMINAARSSAP